MREEGNGRDLICGTIQ